MTLVLLGHYSHEVTFMVLLHFEWVELPPNSHFREGKEALDSPRPPRSVAAHYTDCPYSEKQIKPPSWPLAA